MEQAFYHAHQIIPERCTGRLHCIRACPTRAIRMRNGRITFMPELCIDCGECISVCPEKVFVPLIDEIDTFTRFKYQVAIPSPVFYTHFGPEIHPDLIHRAMEKIGFEEVVDCSRVCQELGYALAHYARTHPEMRPLIITYCPTVIRMIQVSYPNLVNLISPLDVPREIVAKEIKLTYPDKLNLKPEEVGVLYISPCPAKIVSIIQPAEKEHSWIDSALSIKDLYNVLLPEIIEMQGEKEHPGNGDFHFSRDWAVLSHVTRELGEERCLSVAGLQNVKKILDDIENSRLRNIDIIEPLACNQECLGGAFCCENPYILRHNSILLERKYGPWQLKDKADVLRKLEAGHYFMEHPVLPRHTRSSSHDITTSIKRMRQKERIIMKLPRKDCGLCGAPTCETFAEDCAYGEADLIDCVYFSDKFRTQARPDKD